MRTVRLPSAPAGELGYAMNEIPVVAAVIRRGSRVLLGRRPEHKRHGGLWEFPGGKVDEGETDFRAVQRELAEELQLKTVAVGRVLFENRDPEAAFLIRFVEVEVEGDPTAFEHSDIGWFEPDTLRDLPLAPADASFVAHYLLASEG